MGSGPHAVEVDIMQPIDPDKSPKVHIPQLNHIGEAAGSWYQLQTVDSNTDHHELCVHSMLIRAVGG